MFDPLPLLALTGAAIATRCGILLVAMALDWLVGEPEALWRRAPHPVVIFGRGIGFFDRVWNRKKTARGRQRRIRGGVAIAILCIAAGLAGVFMSFGGPIVACLVLAILLAARSLDVGMIVGRDTSELGADDIARAAIETGAENLSDGVVAPAMWFVVAGLPGVMIYKLVNTSDSMIGYRNARYLAFGCAAARLDDLMNLVPARVTALLICLAATLRGRGLPAFRGMIRDARHHASPNAGWPEAAMAGALDLWLAGPRRYGNRVRKARTFHEDGGAADGAAILRALRILIAAQIIFALPVLVLAVSI